MDPGSAAEAGRGAGEHIGRYRIEALLGEGAMGRVFRAWDDLLLRRVAIKVLRAAADDARTVRLILREARMAAALSHPGAVAIFDFGVHEGAPFIVMEHIEGVTLRTFVGRADPPGATRLSWLCDVARALSAAHRAGIVHRDIKPENVMLREDGAIKVLDFGIARPSAAGEPASADGSGAVPSPTGTSLAGTPSYMAPELFYNAEPSPRSDQFAWGVTAYELLSGALPWPHAAPIEAVIRDVLEVQPAPLDPGAVGVGGDACAAVLRALSKDPGARFPTLDALIASIRSPEPATSGPSLPPGPHPNEPGEAQGPPLALAGPAATPERTARRLREAPRRRPALVLWAAAGVLALGGGALAWALGGGHAPPSGRSASPPATAAFTFRPHNMRRLTFEPGCQENPTFTPDGRTLVYDGTVGADYQVFALDLAAGERRALTRGSGWSWTPSVTPDGQSFVYRRQAGERSAYYLGSLDAGAPPRLVGDGLRGRPQMSPDGRAVWSDNNVSTMRMDLETGAVTRTLHPPEGYLVNRIAELRDGRIVATFEQSATGWIKGLAVYAAGSDPAPAWLTEERIDDALAVTPDERLAIASRVSTSGTSELVAYPLDGAPPVPLAGADIKPTMGLALSSTGDRVAWSTCESRTELVVMRPKPGGGFASTLVSGRAEDDVAAVSVPGTSRLLVLSGRAGNAGLWVVERDGQRAPRRIALGALRPAHPAVSPDGAEAVFQALDEGIYLVPLDGGAPPRLLVRGRGTLVPCFSADGATVLFSEDAEGQAPRLRAIPRAGGAPSTLREHAAFPSTTAGADLVAFLELGNNDWTKGTPMLLDRRTGRVRPLSPALPAGVYQQIRLTPDARRAAVVVGSRDVAEVELSTGAVVAREGGPDEILSVTPTGDDLLVLRGVYTGSIWIGDDPLR